MSLGQITRLEALKTLALEFDTGFSQGYPVCPSGYARTAYGYLNNPYFQKITTFKLHVAWIADDTPASGCTVDRKESCLEVLDDLLGDPSTFPDLRNMGVKFRVRAMRGVEMWNVSEAKEAETRIDQEARESFVKVLKRDVHVNAGRH